MNILPNDVLFEIAYHINVESAWKVWIILSKNHYTISLSFPHKIYKPWDWTLLAPNNSMLEKVKANGNKSWNWTLLTGED